MFKYAFLVEICPLNDDATLHQVSKLSTIEEFHCYVGPRVTTL